MTETTEHSAQLSSLREAEETRRLAMLAGDTVALEELFSDTMTYVHSSGIKDSKQLDLAEAP